MGFVKTPRRRSRSLAALPTLAACAMIQGTGLAQQADAPAPAASPPEAVTQAPAPPAAPAPSTTPAPPPAAASHGSKTAALVTGGLAIAAAATGTVFGVIALGDKSDFEKQPTYAKANAGNDSAAYCDAAFGAALVLGATSVILLLAHDDAPAPTAARALTVTASPVVLAHGGGMGAVLRF